MEIARWGLALVVLLLLSQTALAATLHGTVYREDLSVAKEALVTIGTQPEQRLLTTNGTYEFTLPPGNYTIRAVNVGGRNQSVEENVSVAQEGNFTFDLFFFPNMDQENALYNDIATDFQEPPAPLPQQQGNGVWPVVVLILAVLLILFGPFIYLHWHFQRVTRDLAREGAAREGAAEDDGKADDGQDLPADGKLQEVVAILKEEGGRMTQKELRRRLPDSEAKISLLVAELEQKGTVEKIKKGRGNILVLKK